MKVTEAKEDGKEVSKNSKVRDHSDPFVLSNWLQGLDQGKFGSVTKEIEDLLERRSHMLNALYRMHPSLTNLCMDRSPGDEVVEGNQQDRPMADSLILLEDDHLANIPASKPVVIIDLDDEEPANQRPFNGELGNQRPFRPYQEVFLKKPAGEFLMRDFVSSLPAFEVMFGLGLCTFC